MISLESLSDIFNLMNDKNIDNQSESVGVDTNIVIILGVNGPKTLHSWY